ncbi:glycosyltransferase [Paenibacillus elgii]|uniref:glycosyltransferase n=1 Tax=Paenibacillus elgii TaxID=189691 RepID=UPI00203A7172|nr:glycosyltransferase family 4 protein [Paenibacillus elgii]
MQLQLNQQRFDRVSTQFFHHLNKKNYEAALRWAEIAGSCAWFAHPGFYMHQEIEEGLHSIGDKLDSIDVNFSWCLPRNMRQGRRWLHILTAAYTTGGHTRLAQRWMTSSSDDETHSFILLDQDAEIPQWLVTASQKTGGSYIVLPAEMGFMEKAKVVREVSRDWADIVVLHIHPNNPLCSVAFSGKEGPPVIFVNHASLCFWYGVGVADVVLDMGIQDQKLTISQRRSKNNMILPLPLNVPDLKESTNCYKEKLGVNTNSVVMLTSAPGYKYLPYEHLNFQNTMIDILDRSHNKNVILVVLGVDSNDVNWKEAVEKSSGRIKVMGLQKDVVPYYGAADFYLESFPFGSFTASLEAAALGKPIVSAPMPVSPYLVLGSINGKAENPDSMENYKALVEAYIHDARFRMESGELQRKSVAATHLGTAWREKIKNIVEYMPQNHRVGFSIEKPNDNDEDVNKLNHILSRIQPIQGNFSLLYNTLNKWLNRHI